jgi:uncharacterized Zn finger protein (UPF0148 family)
LKEKPKPKFAGRIKYCPECRNKAHKLNARNRYYAKTAQTNRIVDFGGKKKESADFEKNCPVTNCKFKSGNKPCMFFFKYKNGETSCPNHEEYIKIVKKAKKFFLTP